MKEYEAKKDMKQVSLWVCRAWCADAQTGNRPRLAVLPFSGGTGQEGEAIAELLSNERDLRGAFTVIDRNTNRKILPYSRYQCLETVEASSPE